MKSWKPNGISERDQIKISDLGASFLELVELLPELESRLESKSQEELSKIGSFQSFVEGSDRKLPIWPRVDLTWPI